MTEHSFYTLLCAWVVSSKHGAMGGRVHAKLVTKENRGILLENISQRNIFRLYPKEGHPHTTRKNQRRQSPFAVHRNSKFDEHQTISSRHPIRRQNTTKLPTNDGRTPMSSLRFYADTS